MRRFPVFALLLIVLLPISGVAQEKLLTIEDAVIGQWRELYPERMRQLSWKADGDVYTFIEEQTLYHSSVDAPDEKKEVFSLSELNKALKEAGLNEMRYIPAYRWVNDNEMAFQLGNAYVTFDVASKQITEHIAVADEAVNLDKNSTSGNVAYTVENNLFIQTADGEILTITDEKNLGIVNGQEVHRREFGINTGTFWSPNGKALAFYRKDETMVTDYPLVDVTARTAELNNIKYPMAGMKSHHVTVGVYNMESGETTFLKTGTPKDQYLTSVTWGPKGQYIYIAVLNREQNHMWLNKYSAETGDFVKTLFEEERETYVEPSHPLTFLKTQPDKFLYQSRRDGYNHVYLYTSEGELEKQLTSGKWEVTSVLGMDPKERNLYISGTAVSPIDRHVFKVSLRNGKMTQVTQTAGTHGCQLSASGDYLLDTYSSTEVPNKVDLITTKGKQVANLLTATNPLTEYNMPEMKIGTIKAADGQTDLYYRLIKPANFDPNKKYPAIIYVYGGPHAQLINNRWLGGARMWQYYMAQKGYVMLTVDNRGSANRGLPFEEVIHRQLGEHEMADQMKGVDLLNSLGYVDMERIGVHGWSYGGFMTTSLMLKQNEVFKVGVAGGPVIDWKYYEIMYGERYMDTPDENPEGYKQANLKNYVDSLNGRLMLIHGGIDPVVVWQHSLSFARECVKHNKLLDYFVYPRHEHNVRGMDRIHLMRTVTRYFDDHL